MRPGGGTAVSASFPGGSRYQLALRHAPLFLSLEIEFFPSLHPLHQSCYMYPSRYTNSILSEAWCQLEQTIKEVWESRKCSKYADEATKADGG